MENHNLYKKFVNKKGGLIDLEGFILVLMKNRI